MKKKLIIPKNKKNESPRSRKVCLPGALDFAGGGDAWLTNKSPKSRNGALVLRIEGQADQGDFLPQDHWGPMANTTAALFVRDWAIYQRDVKKKMTAPLREIVDSFLSQWPEGPQMTSSRDAKRREAKAQKSVRVFTKHPKWLEAHLKKRYSDTIVDEVVKLAKRNDAKMKILAQKKQGT